MTDRIRITTASEFRDARQDLELSIEQLAWILNTNPTTIRLKWENTGHHIPPNPVACRVLEWMVNDDFRPPEWPDNAGP